MYHLVYLSRSTIPQLPESEVYHLISTCSRRNRKSGITSVILIHSGIFIGFMEGEKQQVRELYQKIEFDPRHFSCRILHQESHERRWFPGIYMGILKESDIKEKKELFNYDAIQENTGKILEIFKSASKHPERISFELKHEVL